MKVLIADKISQDGIKKLSDAQFDVDIKTGKTEGELISIIPEFDAVVVRSDTKITAKIIDAGIKLKIIARAGVGVDNIDVNNATKNGIIVVNSPEGNTIAAAEHTFAMMLSLARNIPQAAGVLKSGVWEKSKFLGTELYNKTLGIVGIGKIGSRVAQYALGLGMKVVCYDPFITEEYAKKLGVEQRTLVELLKISDFITIHIPKTKETSRMIDKEKISIMKNGVRIINCARGGIIDESALLEGLKSKKIAGAALDVFESEPAVGNSLIALDNVIATPHLGASTEEAQVNVAIDVVEQIIDVLNGEPAKSAVNIPAMRPDILAKVKPYLPLAEKLGSIASQLMSTAVSKVEISYSGDLALKDISPLSIAALKGILEIALPNSVNLVNAQMLAKERGIIVKEIMNKEKSDFANLISISLCSDKETKTAAGTLSTAFGERLVQIDRFNMDVVPIGYLLITSHIDTPGIIGKAGTLLGENNINIASMDVGRESIGGGAVMVLNVDNPIPQDVLDQIKKIKGISDARLVKV